MNDEQDTFARWVSGFFVAVFAAAAWLCFYLVDSDWSVRSTNGLYVASTACLYAAWRCLKYAVTGQDSPNRD